MYRYFTLLRNVIIGSITIFAVFFVFPNIAWAASLSLSPSSGTFQVGQNFSVNVYVGSEDQAVNTVVAGLRFSPESLEVKSVTLGGSFINLWIHQPSFNNAKGEISFEGGAFTPGYTGKAGKVATINFRVKDTKNGIIDFTSAQVLANDGQGTNILTSQGTAKFTLVKTLEKVEKVEKVEPISTPKEKPQEIIPPPKKEVAVEMIPAPVVHSPSHPDAETWYQSNAAVMEWVLPPQITQVAFYYDQKEKNSDLPANGRKESQTFTNVPDGKWNFHIKFKGENTWGETTDFIFKLDTTKPDTLDIKASDVSGPASTQSFAVHASDTTSGIDHYEITLDTSSPVLWKDEAGNGIFHTPTLSKGKHTILVRAVDRAGNFIEKSMDFSVEALVAPTITGSPSLLEIGDPLVVSGTSYPNTEVVVYIQGNFEEPVEYRTETNHFGTFTMRYNGILKKNIYKIWAVALDRNDAFSENSNIVVVDVSRRSVGKFLSGHLDIIIPVFLPFLSLFLTIFFFIIYILKQLKLLNRKVDEGFAKQASYYDDEPGLVEESSEETKNKILQKLGELTILPNDEKPQISTVNNLQKLKNQPFFSSAKTGNKVISYQKNQKIFLYDEINNKLLDISHLNNYM